MAWNWKTAAFWGLGFGVVGGLWWGLRQKTANAPANPPRQAFGNILNDPMTDEGDAPSAQTIAPQNSPAPGIPANSSPQVVLGNKQTWRDDIATSIAKTIFNNQYAPDPSDPRRILLVASDGTIPAAKGPQAATTIWRGAVIFKFLPPDRYIASNQGGTEFWVLSESEVPTVSGSGQSQFAVVAYPSTVQTVLGSDPTYKLSAVTNPNIAA